MFFGTSPKKSTNAKKSKNEFSLKDIVCKLRKSSV